MKPSRVLAVFGLMFAASAQLAMAQPSVVVEDVVVPAGTPTVAIDVTFTPEAGNTTSGTFEIAFNSAELSLSDISGCAPPAIWACSNPSPGIVRWASGPEFGGNLEGFTGSIVFDLSSAVVGVTYPLVVQNEEYLDPMGAALTPMGTMDGSIQIVGPSYNSTNPAPGVAIDFGSHTTGDADPTQIMTIDNDGAAGTTLNGSCALGGANPGAFTLAGAAFSVPEAGPNDDVTVGCDSSALAPGNYSATLSCSHDGDAMPASPVDYALSCEILAAPAPTLSSSPQAPGQTIDFGTHNTPDPNAMAVLSISNSGNMDPLTGNCTISNDGGAVFSLTGDPVALNLNNDGMTTVDLALTCDTSTVGSFAGQLSCDHNGSNGPTSTWPLACEVAPLPEYGSTPAPGNPLPVITGDQGDADPTTSLSISNVGEVGSTLTGTCSLTGPDAELYIDGGGGFSVLEGDPAAQITVACDTTAAGSYTNTLSCTHNDGNGDPSSPVTYGVSCEIGPPDPAVYVSSPYAAGNPGDLIDVNEGNPPPPVGGTAPTTVLTISNGAEPGDDFLDLQGCTYTGDPAITASPDPVNNDLDPGASVNVTFTCATDTAGTFVGTYTCPFDDNPSAPEIVLGPEGVGVTSPAEYPVECEVREPFSEVVETPTSGTPQTAELMPGESHTFSFLFEEVLDEGLAASLDDCSLVSGTDFVITSPASFPQPIPSGGSVQVDVQFTDPGVGDTFTDTLNCTYTDNQDGGVPEQTQVTWPLEVTVTGRNARFRVTKDFSDDNPLGVEVLLECNTGLPLQQQGTVHDPDAAGLGPGDFTQLDFVVVDFEPGTMDCDISEVVPDGYADSYFADFGEEGVASSVFADGDGCHYEGVESADFICEISNELLPVTVTVNKEWVDDNPAFNLPTFVEVTLHCNAPIVFLLEAGPAGGNQLSGDNGFTADQFIDPANPGVFGVFPHWDGSTECFVTEEVGAGVLPDLTDCESIPLAPGVDGECTIVNTRLFAGIPTLSQYGLILMALLMLGVGALGFRRYA